MNSSQVAITDASWALLDAIHAADGAQGLDEKQDARWEVTKAMETLEKALRAVEEEA